MLAALAYETGGIYDPGSLFGLLGPFIVLATAVLVGLALWRTNAVSAWRSSAEGWKETADRQAAELTAATNLVTEQKATIERLEALPNLERLVRLMSDTAERSDARAQERTSDAVKMLTDRIEQHERRAEARHDAQIAALRAIEKRLNGGPH